MLTHFRADYERISISFGKASLKLGLKPDFWTIYSLVVAVVACIIIADGKFGWGLVLVIVMNVTDMMDGATARAGNLGSPFGSVFDHTSDRYGEFLLMAGLLLGGWISPFTAMFTASGIVMASYVRAKAESVGGMKHCVVGIAGRQEKLILVMGGLVLFTLGLTTWGEIAILLAGLISHITTLQRLLYARRVILGKDFQQLK
ncbi:MAG TPA: CDP-alcohol phosphatidyltransferase family protein [Anaerolineaceae bacterium]